VTITALDKPAEAIHTSAFLVNVETLLGLEKLRDGPASALIILKLKITDQVMWVKVELFDTERRGNFTFVINIMCIEELGFGVILENVTSLRVLQVTSDIRGMSSLVAIISLTILEYDDITTIISIQFAKDIVHVESSVVCVRRHLHWMLVFAKVLD